MTSTENESSEQLPTNNKPPHKNLKPSAIWRQSPDGSYTYKPNDPDYYKNYYEKRGK